MTSSQDNLREFRRNQRQEARKQKIIATASRLLDEQGLDALTIRHVASEAGYTPAALYPYFDGLRGLYEEVFLYRFSQLLKDAGPMDVLSLKDLFTRDPFFISLGSRALEGGNMEDRGLDRLFTGKVINLLQHVSDFQDNKDPTHIIGLFALVLGISLLETSGRLKALDVSADQIIEHWT